MQLPLRCSCGLEQMVDVERMEVRIVSKLMKAEGFVCSCGEWNPVFYTTLSLEEALKRLEQTPVTHRNFGYYFAKVLRKAEGIQKRQMADL